MALESSDAGFDGLVEDILQDTWAFYPSQASQLGLHEYDGHLPDIAPAALSRRAADVERSLVSLGAIEPDKLSSARRLDHRVLVSALGKELFDLAQLETIRTNPMEAMWHIDVSGYVKRDYAPLEQRVESLTSALNEVPGFLSSLREGLVSPLSGPILEASIESYRGMVAFYDRDLDGAIGPDVAGRVRSDFDQARSGAARAVARFVDHLESLRDGASADFALGEARFLELLKLGEMVDLPLERLLEMGYEDLARNRARFLQVANSIDDTRSPEEVMSEIAMNHPEADVLISETSGMLEDIRRFVVDRDIVSVPSEVRCVTTETPSFMRWAFAALDTPGPYESKATESYYYVTPVEEDWSADQKEEWLSSFNYPALATISVHEAYPGHYVHHLHDKEALSRMSLVFGAYTFVEGWAHYTEEMMVEEGFGAGDPRSRMSQSVEALVRDCRYICAIRMHARGMTVEEATDFFMENAYMERLPAGKEAMRGTFDPMYLNYTLGKLMILKLREDYRNERGANFTLREFHDRFLSFGAPPIPLVRQAMLGDPDDGPL